MYFNYRGVWTGGHNVMGANQPSNEWYFAEGTTRAGFDEWLCIMNPDSERDAKVNVSYMNATGEVKVKEYGVPKSSRFTVDVNGEVGADQDISIKVVSTGAAVVVEAHVLQLCRCLDRRAHHHGGPEAGIPLVLRGGHHP
jgi:hypothetical protein